MSTALRGAGDDEFEVGGLEFGDGRVEQVLAVGIADLGGTDRALERDARERQRGRGTDHGRDIAAHFRVHRLITVSDDLHLVEEAFREQRADRAIDQARDQRLALGLAAFTLEEATRDAATGVELLEVVNREREEVLPSRADLLPTTDTSTTVSAILTITAPPA
jgi:hypothetical protein